jgi:hypothetical protein
MSEADADASGEDDEAEEPAVELVELPPQAVAVRARPTTTVASVIEVRFTGCSLSTRACGVRAAHSGERP